MPVVLKLRSERRGNHVHTTFYSASSPNTTFANLGTLVTTIGEWQSIGAALILGAERMNGNLVVECEGDDAVVSGVQP